MNKKDDDFKDKPPKKSLCLKMAEFLCPKSTLAYFDNMDREMERKEYTEMYNQANRT